MTQTNIRFSKSYEQPIARPLIVAGTGAFARAPHYFVAALPLRAAARTLFHAGNPQRLI